jgi:hypothetical protein
LEDANKKTQKATRQHYVPQFYLRNFKIHSTKESIFCFDRETFKVEQRNIRSIASAKGYYDTSIDTFHFFEKKAGQLESEFSEVSSKILKSENLSLVGDDDRICIARFIAIQFLRVEELRRKIILGGELFGRPLLQLLAPDMAKEYSKLSSLDMLKRFHKTFLSHAFPRMSGFIQARQMVIQINRSTTPMWTSDNPITVWDPDEGFIGVGYNTWHSIIYFPLSPNIALLLFNGAAYLLPEEELIVNDSNEIALQNMLQVIGSTRFVYSNLRDFEQASKMLKSNPGFSGPRELGQLWLDRR